ncbi:hypothetical protein LTR84_005607 [Exophiala bonariae]|uniref:Fungal N-terminal domain-containing protein n=1 Tax=Exophiala bonariae TaxID=1690606 RepID=A0AAV9N5P4_9EURO|nr:hypothetical protein LTR84_005607 [Exophiala bonariae]
MAEALAVLGATAAGVQLGELGCKALIHGITVLRNMQAIPKRIETLLLETEVSIRRIEDIQNDVLQPGSNVVAHLTAVQLARVSTVISEVELAMKSLEDQLNILLPRTRPQAGRLKRIWAALFVLSSEESKLEGHLQHISRASMEILRELLILGLHLEAYNRNFLDQISILIQDNQQSTHWKLDSVHNLLGSLRDTIIDTAQATAGNLTAISDDIQTKHDSTELKLTSIRDDTTFIKRQLIAQTNFSDSQNEIMRTMMRSVIQEEMLLLTPVNREQIPVLRDSVLRIMAGESEKLPQPEHETASHLTTADRQELQSQIGQQLIMRPSMLRDAVESVSLRRKGGLFCTCKPQELLSWYDRGPFRISLDYTSQHRHSCPYHPLGKQSWTYAVSAQLLPFVRRTVELGVNLRSGAGCFSIAPLLNAYCTVRRSESPIFKLFDDFPFRYGQIMQSRKRKRSGYFYSPDIWHHHHPHGSEVIYWQGDVNKASTGMTYLLTSLETVLQNKTASGLEKDENGNTILHEVMFLLAILSQILSDLQPLFHRLLVLALRSGVDVSAISMTGARPLSWFGLINGTGEVVKVFSATSEIETDLPATAAGSLLIATNHGYRNGLEMVPRLYHLIAEYDLDEQISGVSHKYINVNRMNFSHPLPQRRLQIHRLLMRVPELTETFGLTEIGPCIIRRSEDCLVKYLENDKSAPFNDGDLAYDPTCLPIGWTSGLEILLKAGFRPRKALELAILTGHTALIVSVLPYTDFFESSIEERPMNWLFNFLQHDVKQKADIVDVFVVEFEARRREHEDHKTERQHALSLSGLPSVYHGWLNCGGSHTHDNTILLESLFRAGHHTIDAAHEDGRTPLLQIASYAYAFNQRNLAVEWFLSRGASGTFADRTCWPNIMFYLIPSLAYRQHLLLPLDDDIGLYLDVADPLWADDCQCFCSRRGCLPWYRYWSRLESLNQSEAGSWTERLSALQEATDFLRLDGKQKEKCYTELCRLEVFTRLGMIHTCCGHYSFYQSRPAVKSENERERCRKEDAELKAQLDLIMIAYANMRQAAIEVIHDAWTSWWELLDSILPRLSHVEQEWRLGIYKYLPSKDSKIAASRANRERAALVASGYGDYEDFADVIRDHFKEYLDPQVPPNEGSDDEWTDTDFSDDGQLEDQEGEEGSL